jgi:hypothetical protein
MLICCWLGYGRILRRSQDAFSEVALLCRRDSQALLSSRNGGLSAGRVGLLFVAAVLDAHAPRLDEEGDKYATDDAR